VFCHNALSRGTSAEEHILPRWLQKHLGISQHDVSLTLTRIYDLAVTAQRPTHPLNRFVAGFVCRSCNNGWMSKLEVAARPILEPLMDRTRLISDLAREELAVVARWAAKTAFMIDSVSFERRVPREHFESIFRGEITPINVTVFSHQHTATRPFWFHADASWNTGGYASYIEMVFIARAAYKIVIQIGDLILVVARCPFPLWYLRAVTDVHFLIWPIDRLIGWYTHPNWPGAPDSENKAFALTATIALTPNPPRA
jgi:hypothetical protein